MNNLNSVLLDGNLVRDPEMKVIGENERHKASFSIAVNRYYTNGKGEKIQDTVFMDVETWSNMADNCCKYLKKGSWVRVAGRLKQDTWVSKEDGKNRSKILMVAEHVEFRPERNPSLEEGEEDVMEEENGEPIEFADEPVPEKKQKGKKETAED